MQSMGVQGGPAREIRAPSSRSWRSVARDYLLLTKPVIVALLLVTTLAGMIVGHGGWPGEESRAQVRLVCGSTGGPSLR